MKKRLLAGTAFVAAAMLVAGGAMAQDKMKKKMMKPSISVNGYSEAVVGGILDETLGVGESDTSALDVRSDAEIHFNGRTTLDSGMKIHARVELEGMHQHSGPDTIDEYFLSVSGSFGQIVLGGTGGAPVKMLTGSADPGRPASGRRSTSTMSGSRAPMLAPCTTTCSTRGWTLATRRRSPTSPRNSVASRSA